MGEGKREEGMEAVGEAASDGNAEDAELDVAELPAAYAAGAAVVVCLFVFLPPACIILFLHMSARFFFE